MAPPGKLAPGVLTHQAIEALSDFASSESRESRGDRGPVRPCLRKNIRSASYDLRLGEEYYNPAEADRSATLETKRLEGGAGLVIYPNSVVVVTMLEQVVLERNMIGRLSLKMDLLLKGLLMASQSQMDAGYRGRVFALLYNLSDAEVTLKQGSSVIRLELTRLSEDTEHPYDGDYQRRTLAQVLERPIGSSLEQMRQKVDEADARIRRTRAWGAALAVIAVIAPVGLLGYENYFGSIDTLKQRTATLEGEASAQNARGPTLEDACQEIDRLARTERVEPEVKC